MILPKSLLDTVAYYEYEVTKHPVRNGFTSVFTLHFKSFWKWPKKFKMDWNFIHMVDKNFADYQEPLVAFALKLQLADYFKDK